jgi:hypothetical protein
MTVGAAALDAAEQARRAAELAERASAAIAAAPATKLGGKATNGMPLEPAPRPGLEEMGDFNARADRVAERLQRLQRVPLSA